jgi:hypothetical protein
MYKIKTKVDKLSDSNSNSNSKKALNLTKNDIIKDYLKITNSRKSNHIIYPSNAVTKQSKQRR